MSSASFRDRDVRAIYIAMVLGGLLPVLGWLVHGGAAGAGTTIALAMIVAGLMGLARRAHRGLPRARMRRSGRL